MTQLRKAMLVASLGVLAILAWCISSRPSVETYDRLEQRPADAYAYSALGNRYLSVTGDFDDDGRSDEAFFVRVNDKGAGMLSLIVSFGAPTKHDRIVYTRVTKPMPPSATAASK